MNRRHFLSALLAVAAAPVAVARVLAEEPKALDWANGVDTTDKWSSQFPRRGDHTLADGTLRIIPGEAVMPEVGDVIELTYEQGMWVGENDRYHVKRDSFTVTITDKVTHVGGDLTLNWLRALQ